ncbi:hypothetical protein B0J14DRAFT_336176 [Halenospora varia]|nr:hypothetical protein B0J14DRAFT_336176 [Halenospora varia]
MTVFFPPRPSCICFQVLFVRDAACCTLRGRLLKMNSTNETHLSNCTLLTSRSDFAGYVQQINATTNFNVSLLEACQSNICNALWGNGNADISGIGMIVGYMFESALSLVLAVGFAVQKMPPLDFLPETFTQRKGIFKAALKKAHKKFFECAVFFTVSIQIACVVVLVRRDFGISANGLGGFTTQITWSIAVLSMLPLMYPLSALDTNKMIPNKSGYRLFLFCGCWILFFYTFISQMIGSFAPTQVGTGDGGGEQLSLRTMSGPNSPRYALLVWNLSLLARRKSSRPSEQLVH